jgi:putative GTP pyrophosphokinase
MNVADSCDVEPIIRAVQAKEVATASFRAAVVTFFEQNPILQAGNPPVVHSVKSRLKNYDHLRKKLRRKIEEGRRITADNVFAAVTDLAGVRVLHLYLQQFEVIHQAIQTQVLEGEWVYDEQPKAYTWDPETKTFFDAFGLTTELKESYYTSVHYLVRPRKDGPVCCEIQVRTLFEEIWGEIDHAMNYPEKVENLACSEQLRVLAKLVATGSRLAESIFRVHQHDKGEYAVGTCGSHLFSPASQPEALGPTGG